MSKLVRLYGANVLRTDVIIAASDILHNLNMDPESQLADENLGIGQATWEHHEELQLEHDLKPFFVGVRSFYLATIKMFQKFPFRDSLLKDLGVLQPNKTSSYPVSTVLDLAKRFPQLDLANTESLDQLREEFIDFSLSPGDLPPSEEYLAADGTMKPRAGPFWWEIGKMRTFDGQP